MKVRYPKRAASRYMRNMARKDTLATPCILFRERLFEGTTEASDKSCLLLRGGSTAATHSFSSSYMGRMEGWHTKAKVRMGTA